MKIPRLRATSAFLVYLLCVFVPAKSLFAMSIYSLDSLYTGVNLSKSLKKDQQIIVETMSLQQKEFKYKNGACKNLRGNRGYNFGYIGDCGDLSNKNFNSHIFVVDSLLGANLSKANLSYASLYKVKLDGAIFVDANMHECVLSHGSVSQANLSGADLSSASLAWSVLSYSILKGANLEGADLRGATLDDILIDEKTNFSDAIFDEYTWLPFSEEEALERGMKFILTDVAQ